jgi:hypothetical protein
MRTKRQARVYTYRCDLFRPSWPAVEDDNAATDIAFGPEPTYRYVPCYRIDSQEYNVARLQGRGMGELVINSTVFKFPYQQEVGDGWLIVLQLPDGPANQVVHRAFIAQGDPQDKPIRGIRRPNQRKLFATETALPASIDPASLSGAQEDDPNLVTPGVTGNLAR